MNRRLRTVLLLVRLACAALALWALVAGFAGPARAAEAETVTVPVLGGGCPPQFSICSPGGVAVLADYAAMEAGTVAAAPVAAGTAATAASAAGTGSAWLNLIAGLTFGVGGFVGADLFVDTVLTDLAVEPGTLNPGWLGDDASASWVRTSPVGTVAATYEVLAAPAYGQTGVLTVRVRCDGFSGAYTNITTAAPVIVYTNGSQNGAAYPFGDARVPCDNSWPSVGGTQVTSMNVGAPGFAGIRIGPTGSNAEFVAEGSPSRPPVQEAGMTGTLHTTMECTGEGGPRVVSSDTAVSGWDGETPLEVPAAECGPLEVLTGYIVEWVSGGVTQTLVDYTAPEWIQDIPTEFPACLGQDCHAELWDTTGVNPKWCGSAAVGCQEWWADSAKADHYQCRYGPYTVDLGYCAIYRQPGTVSPNVGQYVDPGGNVVGSPEPVISTDPEDFVEIDDLPWLLPEGLAEVLPGGGAAGCWPSGWGVFNPAEWVYRPVTCALSWAFVPSSVVVETEVARGADALAGHGILAVIPASAEVPGVVQDTVAGGCTGDLAVFHLESGAGPMEARFPCTPGEVSPALGDSYAPIYALFAVLMLAGGSWTAFQIVRPYFGSKDQ